MTANVRDVIRYSVSSHPSLPKTLPPATMCFGGTGTAIDLSDQFSLLTETEMHFSQKHPQNRDEFKYIY